MGRDLPPLAAVRVFEAAARQGSFTKAAAELGMTQAAVSYQVKVLEDRVGAPLFLRERRRVVLSETGRRMLAAASEALDILAASFAAARGDASGTLSISVIPTFAATWLARNLGRFQIAHPGIAVRLALADALVDFQRDDFDAAIRTGRGDWPDLEAHRLLEATFTPMLSPVLLERLGGLPDPSALLDSPILDPGDQWWTLWFAQAGIAYNGGDPARSRSLGAQHVESAAAIAAQGVAMLTPFFWRDELASGRLVAPFDLVGTNGSAYWFCYPRSRRNLPKIRAFRDWIRAEFPEDAPRDPPSPA